MAKIDSIKIGNDTYEIDLPSTATPTISSLTVSSLTVTGDLNTASGSANLPVIKEVKNIEGDNICIGNLTNKLKLGYDGDSKGFYLGDDSSNISSSNNQFIIGTQSGIKIYNTTSNSASAFISFSPNGVFGPSLNLVLGANTGSSEPTQSILINNVGATIKGACVTSFIGKDPNKLCSLPNKSGTIALIEDVKANYTISYDSPTYTLHFTEN